MAEKRQPWAKWFWGDWRKDARLRRCAFAARGLWADMLSLMGGECDRYGYLMMEGQALGPGDLAGLLGGSAREISKLVADLEGKRVFSRTGDADIPDDVKDLVATDLPDGVIFSRRMLRDKAKADRDRENGKGGGNPTLKPVDNGGVNPPLNGEDKAQIPESRTQSHTQTEQKNISSFVVGRGKRGGDSVTIEDPNERVARFQKTIAQALGREGWRIVAAAADPTSPDYDQALAMCKATAAKLGKGWPHLWPAPKHRGAA